MQVYSTSTVRHITLEDDSTAPEPTTRLAHLESVSSLSGRSSADTVQARLNRDSFRTSPLANPFIDEDLRGEITNLREIWT